METKLLKGNCKDVLPTLPENSIDSIVTDPPYELGFMGKSWDASGIAYDVEVWRECLRVLKPGGHLLAFGGSRTYHRLACAVEDAGFEIRDQIMWVYGSGFPKSLDVGKAIDKMHGADREVVSSTFRGERAGVSSGIKGKTVPRTDVVTTPATDDAKKWHGWGTALKPSHEPIVVARKPLIRTVAANVLEWGTGAINIDGCRIGDEQTQVNTYSNRHAFGESQVGQDYSSKIVNGRWPANFIHDGSDEVLELFPETKPETSAARFFYCAKASKSERNAGLNDLAFQERGNVNQGMQNMDGGRDRLRQNHHPTVKPIELMRYLIRLVTPPKGIVLDPFAGSGTTLVAAIHEQKSSIGIELTEDYWPIIEARINHAATA